MGRWGFSTKSLQDPGFFHRKAPSFPKASGSPLESLHPAGTWGKGEHGLSLVRIHPHDPTEQQGTLGWEVYPRIQEVKGNRYSEDLAWPLLRRWYSGEEPACQCRRRQRHGFNRWVGKIPWRRKWQSTLVFLPGKFHGQRTLVGYSPWSCKESDMIEQLSTMHTHTRTHTCAHTHVCAHARTHVAILQYNSSLRSIKMHISIWHSKLTALAYIGIRQ